MTFVTRIGLYFALAISVTKVIATFRNFEVVCCTQGHEARFPPPLQWSSGGSVEHLCVFRN